MSIINSNRFWCLLLCHLWRDKTQADFYISWFGSTIINVSDNIQTKLWKNSRCTLASLVKTRIARPSFDAFSPLWREEMLASLPFECFLPSLKGQNAGRFLNFMVSHNLSTRNLNKHVKIPGRIRRLLNGWGHSSWAWPLFTRLTCAHSNQKP